MLLAQILMRISILAIWVLSASNPGLTQTVAGHPGQQLWPGFNAESDSQSVENSVKLIFHVNLEQRFRVYLNKFLETNQYCPAIHKVNMWMGLGKLGT